MLGSAGGRRPWCWSYLPPNGTPARGLAEWAANRSPPPEPIGNRRETYSLPSRVLAPDPVLFTSPLPLLWFAALPTSGLAAVMPDI